MTSCTLSVKNVLRCFITTKTLLKDKLHNHRVPRVCLSFTSGYFYNLGHLKCFMVLGQFKNKLKCNYKTDNNKNNNCNIKIHEQIVSLGFLTLHSFHPE